MQDTRFGCSLIAFDGTMAAVDERWCDLMNRSAKDVVGRSYIDNVAPDHRERSWQCYRDIVETGRGMLVRRRVLDRRPMPITVDISVSVLPATASTPALICGLYVPTAIVTEPPRVLDRREELISAIGVLACQLKGLTAEHQLPFLSSLLDMVALECRTTPERSLQ